jgi:hypothetical protein
MPTDNWNDFHSNALLGWSVPSKEQGSAESLDLIL